MHRPIAGARALVTGASGGLGREIALELARQGASVLLLARQGEKLQALAAEIAKQCGARRAEIVVGDVTDPTARQAAVELAKSALGGLDILVNNAGIGTLGRFENSNPEHTREILETNFFAPVELTRTALPLLKEGRQPIVVNIGSILGHRATPQNSDYCASKFALRGWSQSLRVELAPQGIDVLLVSPGSTATDFWEHQLDKKTAAPWSLKGALPADATARAIVKAIQHGRRELIPGTRARLFVWAAECFPRIFDRILRRFA